jgi:hypothetical protein
VCRREGEREGKRNGEAKIHVSHLKLMSNANPFLAWKVLIFDAPTDGKAPFLLEISECLPNSKISIGLHDLYPFAARMS